MSDIEEYMYRARAASEEEHRERGNDRNRRAGERTIRGGAQGAGKDSQADARVPRARGTSAKTAGTRKKMP